MHLASFLEFAATRCAPAASPCAVSLVEAVEFFAEFGAVVGEVGQAPEFTWR